MSVDLGPGSFTPASIAEQITKKLAASGIGALASVTADNRLVLTSATAGSGVSISYDSRNGYAVDCDGGSQGLGGGQGRRVFRSIQIL
mgnify:CR=1 FL=1